MEIIVIIVDNRDKKRGSGYARGMMVFIGTNLTLGNLANSI